MKALRRAACLLICAVCLTPVSRLSSAPGSPAVVSLECDIARVDGGAEAIGVEYVVDHSRNQLNGEPAEITREAIISRKVLSNGVLLVTRIDATTGEFSLTSPLRGTISRGHCISRQPDRPASKAVAATVPQTSLLPSILDSLARPPTIPQPPPRQPTNYEREATAYATASRQIKELVAQGFTDREFLSAFDVYWQRRLDLADRQDRGQISAEAAKQLRDAYTQQMNSVIERRKQEVQAQLIQELARQQQSADAQRQESSRQWFELAGRLLAPQQPQPATTCSTRWFAGQWVTTCQ
jgi:hypothetical protein